MKFIRSTEVKGKIYRENLLAAIQTFSDQFQNAVMLRRVFSQGDEFTNVSQKHLDEEYNHNNNLRADRNNQPAIWGPALEAATSWFSWKMLSLNDTSKTLLVHFVLESSANVFFHEAGKVMQHFNETSYFSEHAELDEGHEEMGANLLKNLTSKECEELMLIQQGWGMLNMACNRIAKITLSKSKNPKEKNKLHLKKTAK